MNRTISLIAAIALSLYTILSCTPKELEEVPVERVSINQPMAEMEIGETIQLSATVSPSNATHKEVTWSSSKKTVASVSNTGLVTALAEGNTIIYATAEGKTAECSITVSKRFVEVTSISLNKDVLSLVEGDSVTLVPTFEPDDATDKAVIWSSSDPSIATVENGKVIAIKEGTTTITAKAGEKQASCFVSVAKRIINVESIELNKSSLGLIEGESEMLIATVKPDDATDKSVTWTSSDATVATVDNRGVVKAVSAGSCTITARTGYGLISANCIVVVYDVYEFNVILPPDNEIWYTSADGNIISMNSYPAMLISNSYVNGNENEKGVYSFSSSVSSIGNNFGDKDYQFSSITLPCTVTDITSYRALAGLKKAHSIVLPPSVTSIGTDVFGGLGDELEDGTIKHIYFMSETCPTCGWRAMWNLQGTVWVHYPEGSDYSRIENEIKDWEDETGIRLRMVETRYVSSVKKSVTSISLNESNIKLLCGTSYELVATILPDDATDKTVTWTSSNPLTAIVENGKVTAIREGATTITAKAGEKQASCIVIVVKQVIPVESVELNKTSLDLIEGDSETLIATVKPDDATDKTVTWTSSNSSIATVENGKVIAIKEGTTTITAKAGEKQASCVVTVAKRVINVESVELNKTSLELIEGDSETLIATVKPDDATDKTVTWTSSNSSIATVENGKVIAIKEGTTTITAKAREKQATCSVKVKKKPIPVTNLTLDKENLTILVGNEVTLIATVLPDDATDKTVTWKSSNTGAVTVKNGVIKGVGTGKATITATAGNISATCEVLVVYDSEAGVSAKYHGGSISMINGKIQNGSQLNFGVVNYSSETIHVVSVQLIDGQTGQEGNVMNIDADIVPGSSAAWTITIGALGIYEPTARFVYTFKGESYTCEAKYVSINWNF